MSKQIHIVSFDVPFPANYGGVIDVYYKIKALHKLGFKITLHCFDYGRGIQDKLNEITTQVYYYKRSKNPFLLCSKMPFIVVSRKNKTLINNLTQDEAPILFEGLHTTYYLNHDLLKNRIKLVRAHNIEHQYYHQLSQSETSFFKKLFFKSEAKKLEKYESNLSASQHILTLSTYENDYFSKQFENVSYIPLFSKNQVGKFNESKEDFALFHGNLGVAENEKAVIYLIENVFTKIDYAFTVAGSNPSKKLNSLAQKNNVRLVENPSDKELQSLIEQAHINILYTFQATGAKLKLLNALYNGGFCLINENMVKGTDLSELCVVKNKADEIIDSIRNLKSATFDEREYQKRIETLNEDYDNLKNAEKIGELIK